MMTTALEPKGAPPLLELSGITKRFPGVLALDSVDFDLLRGEVHVLFGENGAGKSTLIGIIAGLFPPDSGRMIYSGVAVSDLTPHEAQIAGIGSVFQEFSLAPDLSVEENLLLGDEVTAFGLLNRGAMRAKASDILRTLEFELNVKAPLHTLSRAEQQMVEIAKAFRRQVGVLILDEPTASLTNKEADKLFSVISDLRKNGVGIIYVSHRMSEIKQIANRVTILRDGQKIVTVEASDVEEKQLIELMIGRKIENLYPDISHSPGAVLLETESLTTRDGKIRNASIRVRAGEIVGLAGLVGCGKSNLARAIFGLQKIVSGRVLVDRTPIVKPTPARMLGAGLFYLPADRVAEGLAMSRSIRENVAVSAINFPEFSRFGLVREGAERIAVTRATAALQVRPTDIRSVVSGMSGGNRQKLLLARGLVRPNRIFVLDEPTVGVDVGAKSEIYHHLQKLAESGAAILLISSELPEILHLSKRVYVLARGEIKAELEAADVTEQKVLSHFF
jgi:ribose transport system ATP-binding protein